ncbi:MAG: recombination protein RecR [Deltaproteobacteria bacterium]|nr:recombination protein RecR [Deltaproteobacteria bacterium]
MAGALQRLIKLLRQLPGIGEKTASRMALAILAAPDNYGRALAHGVSEVVERVHPCARCGNLTELEICGICGDSRRDPGLICVVEKVPDLMAIEASGEYQGLYHVLSGVLNPLNGTGPEQIRAAQLLGRLDSGVREVILATSSSVEGEATALYLKQHIEAQGITVSRIASGIPVGGELEYADQNTISRALAGRRTI